MAQQLVKPQPQEEQLETRKRLYAADQSQAFDEFMFLMAEQYNLELMVEAGGKRVPSPTVQFWREALVELSPKQMRRALRDWMKTDGGNFKPNPEDIVKLGLNHEATDKPKRKTDPHCELCGGMGWKATDNRKFTEMTGFGKAYKTTRCDCCVMVYKDKNYKPVQPQLAAGPVDEYKLLTGIAATAKVDLRDAGKPMPPQERTFAPPMTDTEQARQKEILRKKYGA